ncbi:hypothetical protein Ancab_023084 [Ancistrocladus abbreviatus]
MKRLHTRITEIRRIAYDAEDVVDSFILEARASRALDDNGSMAQPRRSIVHSYTRMSIPPQTGNSHLRSLMVFGQANVGIHKYHTGENRVRLTLEPVCQNYQLLRVLNLVAVDTSDGKMRAGMACCLMSHNMVTVAASE